MKRGFKPGMNPFRFKCSWRVWASYDIFIMEDSGAVLAVSAVAVLILTGKGIGGSFNRLAPDAVIYSRGGEEEERRTGRPARRV